MYPRLSDANAADRREKKKEKKEKKKKIARKSETKRAKKRFAHTITRKGKGGRERRRRGGGREEEKKKPSIAPEETLGVIKRSLKNLLTNHSRYFVASKRNIRVYFRQPSFAKFESKQVDTPFTILHRTIIYNLYEGDAMGTRREIRCAIEVELLLLTSNRLRETRSRSLSSRPNSRTLAEVRSVLTCSRCP